MRTILYKHNVSGDILTWMEVSMYQIHLVELVKDDILNWCNDYADYFEADRFLGHFEKDFSIKDIYLSILDGDLSCINEEELSFTSDGKKLLERLEQLLRK